MVTSVLCSQLTSLAAAPRHPALLEHAPVRLPSGELTGHQLHHYWRYCHKPNNIKHLASSIILQNRQTAVIMLFTYLFYLAAKKDAKVLVDTV